jgi:hypothetical protein
MTPVPWPSTHQTFRPLSSGSGSAPSGLISPELSSSSLPESVEIAVKEIRSGVPTLIVSQEVLEAVVEGFYSP